jgi:DnaK suppressor protein
MPNSSHLSKPELDQLRQALVKERATLLAAIRDHADDRRGLVADAEIEDGDVAERQIEQAAALRLGRFDRALLADVDRALAKLEAGTYGTSEATGEPIPFERLAAIPWARKTFDEEEVRAP